MVVRGRTAAIAAGAVALVAAGGAWGCGHYRQPAADGRIYAYYTKDKGEIRLVTRARLRSSERALNWNQTGPAGPPGVPGVPGQPGGPGSAGARGPSDGYWSRQDPAAGDAVPADGVQRELVRLALPAGRYLVAAKSVVDITADVSISRAACYLDDAQFGAEPMGYDSSTVRFSGDHQDVVVLETAVELAAPAELVLKCGVTRGYATFYRWCCPPCRSQRSPPRRRGRRRAKLTQLPPELRATRTPAPHSIAVAGDLTRRVAYP